MDKIATEKTVSGKPFVCTVCDHTRFYERKAQLNTKLASFFDIDFLNKNATCYICEQCGYIHWFMNR